MRPPAEKPDARRFVVPWALFAGVVASFVACCMAGRQTAKEHQLVRFTRFHQMLSPESMFYPTASQVQRLALARTRKDRINVIIGGSSVMQGTGQHASELWSDKLAELLGPDYRVLNLGNRAALTGEFGAIAAEMLMTRRQLIFVTDVIPGRCRNLPDGSYYRYFFWDAWYKGLVDRNMPERNTRLAELFKERDGDAKFAELLRGARLDSQFFYNDLWNTLSYTTGNTVWNRVTLADSFRPRKMVRDNEPAALPVEERPAAMALVEPVERAKARILDHKFIQGPDGQWTLEPAWASTFLASLSSILPNQALRQRTIISIDKFNPYVASQFDAEERAKLSSMLSTIRKVIGETGMRYAEITNTTPEDYADTIHLSASGGEKLALQMAPLIRELAKSLGYEGASEQK